MKGRFLGIDFGTKRIGLAISDEGQRLAFAKEILINDKNVLTKIQEIIKAENISNIVVGESTDFSGQPNAVAVHIEAFIQELSEKTGLPIHKQKEFLTSVEARRYRDEEKKYSNSADAAAAALILQRYLDRKSQQ